MKQYAKIFAEKAHAGQYRRIMRVPYVTHPIRVAERVEAVGFSDDVICAAYLHDVVEDTTYTIEDIEEQFGPRITHLVAAHTEDKTKSWQERKQCTVDMIAAAEKEVKYLIVADRLDNMLDLEKDIEKLGDTVWQNFNAGYESQMWYNQSIVKNMYIGLDTDEIPPYFQEFKDVIKRIFG